MADNVEQVLSFRTRCPSPGNLYNWIQFKMAVPKTLLGLVNERARGDREGIIQTIIKL